MNFDPDYAKTYTVEATFRYDDGLGDISLSQKYVTATNAGYTLPLAATAVVFDKAGAVSAAYNAKHTRLTTSFGDVVAEADPYVFNFTTVADTLSAAAAGTWGYDVTVTRNADGKVIAEQKNVRPTAALTAGADELFAAIPNAADVDPENTSLYTVDVKIRYDGGATIQARANNVAAVYDGFTSVAASGLILNKNGTKESGYTEDLTRLDGFFGEVTAAAAPYVIGFTISGAPAEAAAGDWSYDATVTRNDTDTVVASQANVVPTTALSTGTNELFVAFNDLASADLAYADTYTVEVVIHYAADDIPVENDAVYLTPTSYGLRTTLKEVTPAGSSRLKNYFGAVYAPGGDDTTVLQVQIDADRTRSASKNNWSYDLKITRNEDGVVVAEQVGITPTVLVGTASNSFFALPNGNYDPTYTGTYTLEIVYHYTDALGDLAFAQTSAVKS